ncbi:hypothetical protein N7488_005054 [Penicillium malachiteum]|nr:hypothetical protein N7488_005054 [Penicillium malachiteum]
MAASSSASAVQNVPKPRDPTATSNVVTNSLTPPPIATSTPLSLAAIESQLMRIESEIMAAQDQIMRLQAEEIHDNQIP